MKTIQLKTRWRTFLICSILLTAAFAQTACDSRKPGEGRSSSEPGTKSLAPATNAPLLYINSISDENLTAITMADPIVIETEKYRLEGRKKGEKRKYHNASDEVIYEVKYSDSGFKIKRGEELIWKIKWNYDNKVKLADNEEMNNPYELKKSGENIKLVRGDQEMGKVNASEISAGADVLDKYKFGGFINTLAGGVVLLPNTDLEAMSIIMAELKDSGR